MTRELSDRYLTRAETAFLRSQLRLRFNVKQNSWQVYTTIHGTNQHRWFFISESKKDWYENQFPEIENQGNYHD